MISKHLALHGPVALLTIGLLAFVAFHAWPLSTVGKLFGGPPGYLAGYAGQALLLSVPLWYVTGYGLASLWRDGPTWTRPAAGLLAAALLIGASFADLFAAGFGGRTSSGGIGLWPMRAVAAVVEPVTAPLRKRHYLARLQDSDPGVRGMAASGVSSMADDGGGRRDGGFQRGIARALRSDEKEVRSSLLLALQRSHPLERRALLELVERLADATDEGRAEAADLLGTLGVYGQEEQELRDGLLSAAETDPVPAVRIAAANALGRVDGANPALVALLERWAADGDASGAVMLTGVQGHEWSAAAAFQRRLVDPDPAVREAWTGALKGLRLEPPLLDPPAAALRALADPESRVRQAAVEVLREGFRAEPMVQRALAKALKDPAKEVRAAAALGLHRAEADQRQSLPPDVIGALLEALADPELLDAAAAVVGERPCGPAVARAALAALPHAVDYGPARLKLLLDRCALDAGQVREVAALIASGRPEVARQAVALLGEQRPMDPVVQLALARAVAAQRDEDTSSRAARLLAERGGAPISREARAVLEAAAAAAPESDAGRSARRVLGRDDE